MDGDRRTAVVAGTDHWARFRHQGTILLDDGGITLDWVDPGPGPGGDPPSDPAGLTFDGACVAYVARAGRLVACLPTTGRPAGPGTPFDDPVAVAADGRGRLVVAERSERRVVVLDPAAGRVLSRVALPGRPLDVADVGGRVLVLLDDATVLTLHGRREVQPAPSPLAPAGAERAARLAVTPHGTVLVLWYGQAGGMVATASGEVVASGLTGATDLDVTCDGTVVIGVAGPPPLLRRFRPDGGGWTEAAPLAATGFDGGAVASAPGGRIAFTAAAGFRWSGGVAARRRTHGSVVSYRLDSGGYRTRWGRMFLDACLPPGTTVQARFVTSDTDDVEDPVPAQPAARSTRPVRRPDATPPLAPATALADAPASGPPYRRPTGRERPWAQIPVDDEFETYELPVTAAPGRYLWVALELSGTSRTSPRVRELRAEAPGHGLLTQLPRAWSRDEQAAAFLQSYLAPAEGMVHELDAQAAHRDLLLDPRVAPQEMLGWLAELVGTTLDRRWPEPARRRLIARAFALMRRRGTLDSLREMVGIYLGRDPAVVELWRVRGGPGAVLGRAAGPARAVLGAGMRVGGRVRAGRTAVDGFTGSAHRFCVLVPMELTDEQRSVVRTVLDRHKPSHTAYGICEVGAGMRVGRRAHVALTSVVGPPGGVADAVTGASGVGGATIGRAVPGFRVGEQRAGVRVG